MASILLVYAGTDEPVAKALVKTLEAAGHFVHSAEDPDGPSLYARSRNGSIVVIWSAAALASPYVYEDARSALKAGRLVQVSTVDLNVVNLPPVFRAHPVIPIADSEQLLRTISRAAVVSPAGADPEMDFGSGPEMASFSSWMGNAHPREKEEVQRPPPVGRVAPLEPAKQETRIAAMVRKPERAPAPKTPPQIPRQLSQAAIEKEAGQLVHGVPRKMRVGVPELVEVRLGRAHQVTAFGLVSAATEDLPIVETMTVNLHGAPDAFQIVRRSRQTQLVMDTPVWGAAFDQERFGRWTWHVTPKKSGTHELVVKVSADLFDSRGVPTSEPYRDRDFPVSVRVNFVRATGRVLKWTATGAVTALAGAYTQEAWWPKLKGWLVSTGFMS